MKIPVSSAAGAPGAASTLNSPPLGEPPEGFGDSGGDNNIIEPPSQPDGPGVQLPPPPTSPTAVTDGTPAPCRQKNAAEFLSGRSPGVMQQYGQGLFGAQQHTHSAHPAPDDAAPAVKSLVDWREEAPYG